jgi:tRNA G46 methylase TrmB
VHLDGNGRVVAVTALIVLASVLATWAVFLARSDEKELAASLKDFEAGTTKLNVNSQHAHRFLTALYDPLKPDMLGRVYVRVAVAEEVAVATASAVLASWRPAADSSAGCGTWLGLSSP